MGYFPAFIKLDNKKILLVGGGKVAYEKLLHLLDFSENIAIIAEKFSDAMLVKMDALHLQYNRRSYEKGDIAKYDIVVVAIDDIALQATIFEESKEYKCLCNAVDSTKYCDFLFPSYIKQDDLIIAVSTSGASPAMAKYLRIYLQKLIPKSIGEFLKEMRMLRKELPKGKERMQMLNAKAQNYVSNHLS